MLKISNLSSIYPYIDFTSIYKWIEKLDITWMPTHNSLPFFFFNEQSSILNKLSCKYLSSHIFFKKLIYLKLQQSPHHV